MNIAIIGPSGAGKGTHAAAIEKKYGLTPLGTGELFRKNLGQRTAVGFLAKGYIAKGELVPDEVADAMVAERLWQMPPEEGVLLDGFPRTVFQAKFLDEIFTELGRSLTAVIYIRVSHEVIIDRLSGREICKNCQSPYHKVFNPPKTANICDVCGGEIYTRASDIPEMIKVRLRAFHRVIRPVLRYYRETGRLIEVDGEGSIDEVLGQINYELDRYARRVEIPRQVSAADLDFEEEFILSAPAWIRDQSMDLVFVGGPGSGKGTQAKQLSEKMHLPHIASGDLFRENIRNQTRLGHLAELYINRGDLVPDDVTEAMVDARISFPDTGKGFILDGFPRTVPQAQALTEMMEMIHRGLDAVLYIKVSDEEIIERLSGRLICRDCQTPFHRKFNHPENEGVCDVCGGSLYQRDDDNPNTVRARIKTFHSQTASLLNYYRRAGLLIEIEGEGDVDDIAETILEEVQRLYLRMA